MSGRPRISCVILCHNYGRYLGRAIESCLEQEPGKYTLHEVIVIDDGSTDETEAVCRRFDGAIRIIRRNRRGFGRTLTDAFHVSTGDWVALLDADDWFDPSKLRTCAEAMTGEALLVEHWERVVDTDGHLIVPDPHPGGNTSTLVVDRAAGLSLLPVTNEMFFHALREAGRGVVLRNPLTFYRVHPRSMTDRSTPGVSQDYRADVCAALSERLQAMRKNPLRWVTRRRLGEISWHFRTLAFGHRIEAAMQRSGRISAALMIPGMLGSAMRAREPLTLWPRSLSSVIAGKPLVRLSVNPDQDVES